MGRSPGPPPQLSVAASGPGPAPPHGPGLGRVPYSSRPLSHGPSLDRKEGSTRTYGRGRSCPAIPRSGGAGLDIEKKMLRLPWMERRLPVHQGGEIGPTKSLPPSTIHTDLARAPAAIGLARVLLPAEDPLKMSLYISSIARLWQPVSSQHYQCCHVYGAE